MELASQKSKKSRMQFFSRRSSSIGSNVSFKSVGSTFSFSSSANFGSRDESFFESKLNFESDAEEEFQSVHGDSTPSETATPNNKTGAENSKPSKSTSVAPIVPNGENGTDQPPGDQKVKLADLLKQEQESIRQEQGTESSKNLKMEKLSSIVSRGSSGDEIETPSPRQSRIISRSFRGVPCAPCLTFSSCVKYRRKAKTTDTAA